MEVKVDRTLVHIVDDNATFRKTIEGRLEQFGYAGLHLSFGPTSPGLPAQRRRTELYPSRRSDAVDERSRVARALG